VKTAARRELAIAAFLAAFGGVVVALARKIAPGVSTDPLGPAAFPLALGACIGLCGLLLGAATLIFSGQPAPTGPLSDAEPDEATDVGPFSPLRLAAAVLATAAYLAAFEPLGYVIATPLYVMVIMLIHGGAGRHALLAAPVLVTAALYATFRFGLLIPVPGGILETFLR
jgi:hypothetical protein